MLQSVSIYRQNTLRMCLNLAVFPGVSRMGSSWLLLFCEVVCQSLFPHRFRIEDLSFVLVVAGNTLRS